MSRVKGLRIVWAVVAVLGFFLAWWTLTPGELLVRADPYYAGVIGPVLIFAVPCALAIAIAIALGGSPRP